MVILAPRPTALLDDSGIVELFDQLELLRGFQRSESRLAFGPGRSLEFSESGQVTIAVLLCAIVTQHEVNEARYTHVRGTGRVGTRNDDLSDCGNELQLGCIENGGARRSRWGGTGAVAFLG